jgi:Kef-type K+ transport system membrane component KefB
MACLVFGSTSVHVEQVTLTLLVQLIVIMLAARLFATLFRWFRQPAVVGEIAAGLILGPSLLGRAAPELSAAVFDPSVAPVFDALSQLGLVFLLFLIGLEFDFGHLRWHGTAACGISLAGIVLPFALGIGLGPILLPHLETQVDLIGFCLFLGTALSITAIPILGRMMMELNISRTRLGTMTIAAAAVDDACGWILLAAVASVVQTQFEPARIVMMFALTILFTGGMLCLARPALRRAVRIALRRGDGELGQNGLAFLIVLIFLCAIATNLIGIFSIFGAFVLGVTLSSEHELRLSVGRQMRHLVNALFLPIFFTYTGLRTDIGSLGSVTLWALCGLVCLTAVVGKFGGCGLAARLSGLSWRESACVGVMMNTRALMALIVINLGMDLGVITPSVFSMLVLMALVTTVMTTPALLWLMKGTELEPHIRDSGFVTMPSPHARNQPGGKKKPVITA